MNRWRTILVGCGNIGVGYADDPVMARYYPYATHAQALHRHSAFDWVAAIDTNTLQAERAAARWGIPTFSSVTALPDPDTVEIAVLAVPPGQRLALIDLLPRLRAVIVEKPLGSNLAEAEAFVAACERRAIVVQVNLPRRCDATLRALAAGGLVKRIGPPQGATLVYGNGLLNNGTHMIDLARMLLGDVASADVVTGCKARREGPIDGDINIPFVMRLESGIPVFAQPVTYARYRELAIDIWGEQGRLALTQEGLNLTIWGCAPHRAMQGQNEIVTDAPVLEHTTIGEAQKAIYDDLADSLRTNRLPASSARSALQTARIVDTVHHAAMPPRSAAESPHA